MTRPPVIVGGGSWGSALATALQAGGQSPTVLVRDQETVRLLAAGRCRQLAELPAVAPIRATTNPACLADAGLVFLVVPVSATAAALAQLAQHAPSPDAIVLCAKGMAMTTDGAALMPELAGQLAPTLPAVILSGPSFADEVMAGLPLPSPRPEPTMPQLRLFRTASPEAIFASMPVQTRLASPLAER